MEEDQIYYLYLSVFFYSAAVLSMYKAFKLIKSK